GARPSRRSPRLAASRAARSARAARPNAGRPLERHALVVAELTRRLARQRSVVRLRLDAVDVHRPVLRLNVEVAEDGDVGAAVGLHPLHLLHEPVAARGPAAPAGPAGVGELEQLPPVLGDGRALRALPGPGGNVVTHAASFSGEPSSGGPFTATRTPTYIK